MLEKPILFSGGMVRASEKRTHSVLGRLELWSIGRSCPALRQQNRASSRPLRQTSRPLVGARERCAHQLVGAGRSVKAWFDLQGLISVAI